MPLSIEIGEGLGGFRGKVAQYHGIGSIEALEEKLAQFPKGTRFVLTTYGVGTDAARARIQKYAAAHGLMIVSDPVRGSWKRSGRSHAMIVRDRGQQPLEMAKQRLMKIAEFETRRAHPSDADEIAVAHRDTIRSNR